MDTKAGARDAHDEPGRRSFLKQLARIGGATAAGAAAFAGTAHAQARRPTRSPGGGRRRATDEMNVTGRAIATRVPALQQPAIIKPVVQTVAGTALPSTRARALKAVSRLHGGRELLTSLGMPADPGGDPATDSSAAVQDAIQDDALVQAYAEGVVLTAADCEPAAIDGLSYPPVTYVTQYGYVIPATVRLGLCNPHAGGRHPDSPHPLIRFGMTMPGTEDEYLTYMLELYFIGVEPDDVSATLNDEPVSFMTTSDDTWVLLVEMPGSGPSRQYTNALRLTPQNTSVDGVFIWLNVMVL